MNHLLSPYFRPSHDISVMPVTLQSSRGNRGCICSNHTQNPTSENNHVARRMGDNSLEVDEDIVGMNEVMSAITLGPARRNQGCFCPEHMEDPTWEYNHVAHPTQDSYVALLEDVLGVDQDYANFPFMTSVSLEDLVEQDPEFRRLLPLLSAYRTLDDFLDSVGPQFVESADDGAQLDESGDDDEGELEETTKEKLEVPTCPLCLSPDNPFTVTSLDMAAETVTLSHWRSHFAHHIKGTVSSYKYRHHHERLTTPDRVTLLATVTHLRLCLMSLEKPIFANLEDDEFSDLRGRWYRLVCGLAELIEKFALLHGTEFRTLRSAWEAIGTFGHEVCCLQEFVDDFVMLGEDGEFIPTAKFYKLYKSE